MPRLKPCPCPICGVKLKKKITVRGETVFDHPKNGCKIEWKRVRSYTIADWNRRVWEGGWNNAKTAEQRR